MNIPNHAGSRAIHWAARKGNANIVKCLIDNGADVNAKDNSGKTAIHDAAYAHTGKLWQWLTFWIVLFFFGSFIP